MLSWIHKNKIILPVFMRKLGVVYDKRDYFRLSQTRSFGTIMCIVKTMKRLNCD